MNLAIAPSETSIVASGIGKRFGEKPLWSNISFAVQSGEMVAISGPSGSGKTTLLNCIGLLDEVSEGSLRVCGHEVMKIRSRSRRLMFREKIGFLFQNYGLVDSWTVDQNLNVALAYTKLRPAEKLSMKMAALEQVGLAGVGSARVFTMSGGEQQRVALARLLLKRPSIILADEPTGSLDSVNSEKVMGILSEFQANGASVLVSTHDPRVVERCSRSILLA